MRPVSEIRKNAHSYPALQRCFIDCFPAKTDIPGLPLYTRFWFYCTSLCDWSRKLAPPLKVSDAKPKSITIQSLTFSSASGKFRVIGSFKNFSFVCFFFLAAVILLDKSHGNKSRRALYQPRSAERAFGVLKVTL